MSTKKGKKADLSTKKKSSISYIALTRLVVCVHGSKKVTKEEYQCWVYD